MTLFQVFKCPRNDCGLTFVDVNKLIEHLNEHDRANEAAETTVDSNLLTHRCAGGCGASFASEEEVAFHQITSGHHDHQPIDIGRVSLEKPDTSRHQDTNQVLYTQL